MRMRISRAELKRREDRKSLRHMYVTLKYGDGVCAANSIRQDFQCGHDELIWGIRHHLPLPLPAHCSLWWNLAWGLPIADGDAALPCHALVQLVYLEVERRDGRQLWLIREYYLGQTVWSGRRVCGYATQAERVGGVCGRLLFDWRWFWVLMMSLTLMLRLIVNFIWPWWWKIIITLKLQLSSRQVLWCRHPMQWTIGFQQDLGVTYSQMNGRLTRLNRIGNCKSYQRLIRHRHAVTEVGKAHVLHQ